MKLNKLILYFFFCISGMLYSLPLYGTKEPEDTTREENYYEYIEYSPLTRTYELWGWNIPRYYFYQYLHLFKDYPWIVRVAYIMVFFSVITFFVLALTICIDVYYIQRNKRFENKIRKRYFRHMKEICYKETINLSAEEIIRRMDYKQRKWRFWQLRIWTLIMVDLSRFANTHSLNLRNIQTIMQFIGIRDYVEHNLVFGPHKRKVRLLQAVRLTNMRLSDSLVTHLVNDKNQTLRKAARTYYMLTSKDDPYIFFEDETLTIDATKYANFSLWDRIEIHEIFNQIHNSGRALPRFVPLLQTSKNRDLSLFFMRETAYWGTERELKYIVNYFDSSDFSYRQTAFECMGIRRYTQVEDTMKDLFYKQTEALRRTILNALLEMNTENNLDFYIKVYKMKSSDYTRRTALRCLWLSGAKGREEFEQLKAVCSSKDRILFEHVENPIINND